MIAKGTLRDHVEAMIRALHEDPELTDEIVDAFLRDLDASALSTERAEWRPIQIRSTLSGFCTGFATAMFSLSVLLHTAIAAPLAAVSFLVMLVSLAPMLRFLTVRWQDRQYLREELQWRAQHARPSIVTRLYATDQVLLRDAERLADLGYDVSSQQSLKGGQRLTFKRSTE